MSQGKYIAVPIRSLPGVDVDGTEYASRNYTLSEGTRFFEKLPAKIGGFLAISLGLPYICRSMFNLDLEAGIQIFLGRTDSINYFSIFNNQTVGPEVDITPSVYVADPARTWSMDKITVTSPPTIIGPSPPYPTVVPPSTTNLLPGLYLIAAATQNGFSKNNNSLAGTANPFPPGQLYYSEIGPGLYSTVQLCPLFDVSNPVPNTPIQCTGGVICTPTFVVAYGSNGVIQWSNVGTFYSWGNTVSTVYIPNQATVSSTKVITARLAPGSTGTTILFWTNESIERTSFIEDPTTFVLTPSTQTIQSGISILSGPSLIQYNQLFYWPSQGQFNFFNGAVNILENNQTTNFFFDNLDYSNTSKMWGLVQPRFGELWWYWVSKNSPNGECDMATVFDTINNTWWNTPYSRSSGIKSADNPYPILSSSQTETTRVNSVTRVTYPVWQHDTGLNKVIAGVSTPIKAKFRTHIMDLFSQNPEQNVLIRARRLQPDFVQQGPMDVIVYTRMFPAEQAVVDGPYSFLPNTPKIDLETMQGALVNFEFSSNVLDGYFRMGKTIFEYLPGDNVR